MPPANESTASISVTQPTFDKIKAYCEAHNIPMKVFVEELIEAEIDRRIEAQLDGDGGGR